MHCETWSTVWGARSSWAACASLPLFQLLCRSATLSVHLSLWSPSWSQTSWLISHDRIEPIDCFFHHPWVSPFLFFSLSTGQVDLPIWSCVLSAKHISPLHCLCLARTSLSSTRPHRTLLESLWVSIPTHQTFLTIPYNGFKGSRVQASLLECSCCENDPFELKFLGQMRSRWQCC